MKILVDTNIFIDFFKGADSLLDNHKNDEIILSGVVYVELLYGCRNDKEKVMIQHLYSLYCMPEIDHINWENTGSLLLMLRRNGLTVSFQDALLASQCLDFGLHILTKDKHFEKIQKVIGKQIIL